jgi:predicted transposase/invertase (TIGR01784 family)
MMALALPATDAADFSHHRQQMAGRGRMRGVSEGPFRLDPKKDAVFKLLLGGSEPLLIALLTAVLRPPIPIRRAFVQNPGLPKDFPDDKGSILDIVLVLDDHSTIEIEMQADGKGAFCGRALYYWAGLFHGQLKAGNVYSSLRPVVSVLFLNYREFSSPEFHEVFRLRGDSAGEVFSPLLEFHAIELPKLTPEQADSDLALSRWCRFLSSEDPREIERLTQEDPMIEKAERKLLELSADPDVRAILAESERREAGHRLLLGAAHADGEKKGRAEGRRELLEAQLREAFGPLPDDVRVRLAGASEVDLTRWAKRILKAKTLDEVFG